MAKISILAVAIASLFLLSSISAEPNAGTERFMDGLKNVFLGISEAVGSMGNGGMAEKAQGLKSLIAGALGSKGGGGRMKRSIHSSVTFTKYNQTNVQKLEVSKTWDKDHEKLEMASACLVKDNEIYWLEYMTSALILLMEEMKKVLDGKVVPFKMTDGAYNKTKPH